MSASSDSSLHASAEPASGHASADEPSAFSHASGAPSASSHESEAPPPPPAPQPPSSFTTVKHHIVVESGQVREAVNFYVRAFGAVQLERGAKLPQPSVGVKRTAEDAGLDDLACALIQIGEAFFLIASDDYDFVPNEMKPVGIAGTIIHLESDDVQATKANVINAVMETRGAAHFTEGSYAHGVQMRVKDAYGNLWLIIERDEMFL